MNYQHLTLNDIRDYAAILENVSEDAKHAKVRLTTLVNRMLEGASYEDISISIDMLESAVNRVREDIEELAPFIKG